MLLYIVGELATTHDPPTRFSLTHDFVNSFVLEKVSGAIQTFLIFLSYSYKNFNLQSCDSQNYSDEIQILRQSHFPLTFAILSFVWKSFSAFCYCKKQIDVSFLCVCPLIDDKFRHNVVKVF